MANKRDPFSLLDLLQNDLSRMFDTVPSSGWLPDTSYGVAEWIPAVDIKEDEESFILHADLPGIDIKDVDITMDRNVLSIKGTRTAQDTSETEKYRRTEREGGTFFRQFTLPDHVAKDKITASVTNGVLEIVLPKANEAQPRRIEISA